MVKSVSRRRVSGAASLLAVLLTLVIAAVFLAAVSRAFKSTYHSAKIDHLSEQITEVRNRIMKDAVGRLDMTHIDNTGIYVKSHNIIPDDWIHDVATNSFRTPDGYVVVVNHYAPAGYLPATHTWKDAVTISIRALDKGDAIDIGTRLSRVFPVVAGNSAVWFRNGQVQVNFNDVLTSYPDKFTLNLVAY